MQICYTSDLHGSLTLYEELGSLLRRERPQLAILGGDMFPDGQESDLAGSQAAFLGEQLLPAVTGWKRDVPGLQVACLMGNHDWLATEQALRQTDEIALLRMDEIFRCHDMNFLGCPLSPPTPHFAKDYERLDQDGDRLPAFDCGNLATVDGTVCEQTTEHCFKQRPSLTTELSHAIQPKSPWIFVAHVPPYDSQLDRLPNVDAPIGSRAVRDFIAARRPLLALHGHVHESPEVTGSYVDTIDGVLCINPGQSRQRLHAVLFDTDDPRGTLRHTVIE